MHTKQKQINIQKNENKPEIICNKVSKRFLLLSESVALGLEPEPRLDDFKIKKELGKGSFGQVFLAEHLKTKANYAIKAIDKRIKNNEEGIPYFRREIEIMNKIKHPNCVRFFGNFEDEKYCYFIMEYASKGNLYDLIQKNKKAGLDKVLVAKIIRELINTIHYLHSLNPPIIHRDIKPENILLTNENKIKLTDFGWANYMNDKDEKRNTLCGTPLYLAPEMIDNTGHGKPVDIWCIGVLLFELLAGFPPFYYETREALLKNIMKLHILWPKYPKKEIDSDAKDLISKILKLDPNKRISLEEMIKHPFFTRNCPEYPAFLEKTPLYENKPYIISKNIPADDLPIISKKIKINGVPKSQIKRMDTSPKHISPRIYNRNKNFNINYSNNNYTNIEENENTENKIDKGKYFNDEEKKILINNKSATNFFPKNKTYKKKINKYSDKKMEILLEKIKEYEKKDKENQTIINELSLKNKNLIEGNLTLNNKLKEMEEILKEKEEELKDKDCQIKILRSKKILLNYKNNYLNNISQNSDNEDNNYNCVNTKQNSYTSRTPDVSKRKKRIPITANVSHRKKYLINNNNIINKTNSGKFIQEGNDSYDISGKSTKINSLDSQEIDKLKRELKEEKEKHENELNALIKEIKSLKNENKNIKEKDKNEIIKLTQNLTENKKEIKKWKTKYKELEKIINDNNNDC